MHLHPLPVIPAHAGTQTSVRRTTKSLVSHFRGNDGTSILNPTDNPLQQPPPPSRGRWPLDLIEGLEGASQSAQRELLPPHSNLRHSRKGRVFRETQNGSPLSGTPLRAATLTSGAKLFKRKMYPCLLSRVQEYVEVVSFRSDFYSAAGCYGSRVENY